MVGDKLIGQNKYGELFERKEYDGIKNIFIISQGAFDKVYEAHLNWYNKFKSILDRIYLKDEISIDIKLYVEKMLDYSEDNCKRYNHKSFLDGLVYFINKEINNEDIIFSYENVIIPKDCNLKFAELYNSKLEDKNFNNAHFKNTNFKYSYLSRVNFEKSYFNGANFEGAILSEVNFNDGNSYKVNFEYTNLEQINFNINLTEANFKDALLHLINFEGSDLFNSNFESANLLSTSFEGAFFGYANFKNADLSDVVLYSESLKKIDFETKEVIEDRNQYQHPDVNFQGAILHNVDLSHIQGLTATQIAGADLTCAKLPQNLDNLTEVIKSVNETIRNKGILSKDLINFLLNIFLYALLLSKDFTLASIPFHETYIKVTHDMLWMVSVVLYFIFLSSCINLSSFWNILGNLPAIFPDGRKLPEVIDHWSPTSWIYLQFTKLNNHKSIVNKKTSIYVQAIFSYIILYLPIPVLMIYICVKFGMYHSMYCSNRDSVVSWVFTILTIGTLYLYSRLMIKSLDK